MYSDYSMFQKWVKSLTAESSVNGVAINPLTYMIIAHTTGATSTYILILDSFGSLKGAYTYAGPPAIYDSMTRNLLLGYKSSTLTYTALVQTALLSRNGYKLFAFTFSSVSSTPTFLWGFDSL